MTATPTDAAAADAPENETPWELLRRDHERLDAQMGALLTCAEQGDGPSCVAPWRVLERGLLAHMAAEETEIFPAFIHDHAPLIATLKLEHDAIRAILEKLGLEVELHEVRLETIRSLVTRLRAHAAVEDKAFYPLVNAWAGANLVRDLKRRLARLAS